ncbi:right-handed parallel beta-helix repeat-containing protein [Hymenobacter sp.]|uniref:right-handed parallel beta-helix repeat-containing protein n=1 Tax=Hymenobacter sp. TaxID=1898978 RepID=UPI00286A440A|nr:right-handed parallel beta-helix repeat-containing protein [Hymenobacter sp.]
MKKLSLLLLFGLFGLAELHAQAVRLVANANDTGPGSLRQALASAANGDSVLFVPGLANQTIRLASQLTVNRSVVIDGRRAPNLTLDGQNQVRILLVEYSFVTVVVRNLTFARGRAADANPATKLRGGAIELLDPNTLRVESCRFLGNVGERGGAIFVGYGARATVLDCVFDRNDGAVAQDGFSAGAIATYGGGPAATVLPNGVGGAALLDVRRCTFTRNKGVVGGGIYVLLGGLRVEDCLFRKNEADAGGAIFQDGCNGTEQTDNVGGTTTIRRCVVDSNTVHGLGGGFFLWGYSLDKYVIENTTIAHNRVLRGGQYNESKGGAFHVRDRASLLVRNCTLADNEVAQQGGGMWLDCRGPEGITVENCTFSGNRASTATGGGDIGGAAVFNTPASVPIRITNSTFVGNAADRADGCVWIAGAPNAQNLTFTNCAFAGNRAGTAGSAREQTVNFPALSGGGNFVQNTAGAVQNLAAATYGPDLGLRPLQSFGVAGQQIWVHPLARTSPLVDAGVPVAGLAADQLGTARPQDGNGDGTARFDAGAVELTTQGPLATAAAGAPAAATLAQNFPNPFAARTTIAYVLREAGPARLRLCDATGRTVATLVDGPRGAGAHAYALAAADWALPGGVYYYVLETAGTCQRRRLVLLR